MFPQRSVIRIEIYILNSTQYGSGASGQVYYYPLRHPVDLDVSVEGVGGYYNPHIHEKKTDRITLCYFL